MTSTDIYRVLSSVPHNSHYLFRYIKIVNRLKTQQIDNLVYTELHHICPKASDLFPNVKNLQENPWNALEVTPRQHFLLHWLLWKCFGKSQTNAFFWMNHCDNRGLRGTIRKLSGRSYEVLKQNQNSNMKLWHANEIPDDKRLRSKRISEAKSGILFSEEHKRQLSIAQTGLKRTPEHLAAISKANTGKKRSKEFCIRTSQRMKEIRCYKNYLGECIFLNKNDPRVLSGEYIGNASKPKFFRNEFSEIISVLRNDPRVLSGEYKLV